jgi:hypothetical protein
VEDVSGINGNPRLHSNLGGDRRRGNARRRV